LTGDIVGINISSWNLY